MTMLFYQWHVSRPVYFFDLHTAQVASPANLEHIRARPVPLWASPIELFETWWDLHTDLVPFKVRKDVTAGLSQVQIARHRASCALQERTRVRLVCRQMHTSHVNQTVGCSWKSLFRSFWVLMNGNWDIGSGCSSSSACYNCSVGTYWSGFGAQFPAKFPHL